MRVEKIGNQTLILGDCMAVMPTLGRFDAVVTDPPYGIAEDYLKPSAKGEWSKHYGEAITWDSSAPQIAIERALSFSDGSGVIWGGNYFALPPVRGWLIWDKMQAHSSGHAELAWTSVGIPIRTFSYCRAQLASEGKQHPTQKPVALMEWCLGFLPDAKTILDPYAGSGTVAVACQRMGRFSTSIEIDPDYFDIACKRVDEAARQPDLLIPETRQAPVQDGFDL